MKCKNCANNDVLEGKIFCSRACANKYNAIKRTKNKIETKHILPGLESMLNNIPNTDTNIVLNEIKQYLALEELSMPIPNTSRKSKDDYILSMNGIEMRPFDKLSYDIIDQMLRSGVIMFIIDMKRASIIYPFKNGRTYSGVLL